MRLWAISYKIMGHIIPLMGALRVYGPYQNFYGSLLLGLWDVSYKVMGHIKDFYGRFLSLGPISSL